MQYPGMHLLRDTSRHPSAPSLNRLLNMHPTGRHSLANLSVITFNVWKQPGKLRRTLKFQHPTFFKRRVTRTGGQNTAGYKSQLSYL